MNIHIIKAIISDFLTIIKWVEKKNKLKYLILQIHIFFSAILETLSVFTIIPIIESLNKNTDSLFIKFLENYINYEYLNFTYLIIAFCCLLILSNLYLILIKKKITDFSYVLMLDVQKKVFKKIIHNKYEFFINKDISYFNNVILHETQRLKSGFIESSLFILSQILLIIFTFTGLMIYDYKITIFIILILLIFYLFYFFLVGDKLIKVSKLNTKYKKETIQYLNDIFSVIKTLVFKKNKSKFYEKLENILSQNYKANKFEQIIRSIIKNSFEIYFLIIIILIIFLKENQLQADIIISYGVFLFAAYKIIPSVHLIYSHIVSFLGSSNSLKVITKELTNKNLYPEITKDNFLINNIKLNNVSFSYDKKKNVLKNINYDLPKNKIVGICGKSGSGKTTFIDLISGLIAPIIGNIYINNKINETTNELLISNSSYCSQKTILIDDTIENNICLQADNKIDKELLSEAIKIAELEEFVQSFENGVYTVIGEKGIRISGGEAQRINIARTIYLNRKFIYFDESLNNLDMITSKKILNNLKKISHEKTIFFITHDLRLLSDFEEVLIFNEGKLVENASYSKLKEASKLFLELLDNPS
jgi:ATP-binding cassette, subfamily B, bacterial PglK